MFKNFIDVIVRRRENCFFKFIWEAIKEFIGEILVEIWFIGFIVYNLGGYKYIIYYL